MQIELDHVYNSGKLSERDTEREDGDDGGKVRREMQRHVYMIFIWEGDAKQG